MPRNLHSPIIKTLTYADLFDYPLSGSEIHKYLIASFPVSLVEIIPELKRLSLAGQIGEFKGFYFLARRQDLVEERFRRQAIAGVKMNRVAILLWFSKYCPWVKMVGLTGALAMQNALEEDDVDLMIVSQRQRMWLTRFLVFGLLKIFNLKVGQGSREKKDRICINLWCDQENLAVAESDRDLVIAHEIAQMKPLVNKEGTYEKFISQNLWLKNFLPNWKI